MKISPVLEAKLIAAGATVTPCGNFGLPPMLPLEVDIPCEVVSEANLHQYWMKSWRRKKAQEKAIEAALFGKGLHHLRGPLVVTMMRLIGPKGKKMDCDNLARAFKGVRDAIAVALKRDDGDGTVRWVCEQESSPASGVRVMVAKQ